MASPTSRRPMRRLAPRETTPSLLGGARPRVPRGLDAYLADLRAVPELPEPDQRTAAERAQTGDAAAREQLIRANLRFAVAEAKRHGWRSDPDEFLEMIQDANLAMVRAADHFDPAEGVTFRTYASQVIRRAVREGLLQRRSLISAPTERLVDAARAGSDATALDSKAFATPAVLTSPVPRPRRTAAERRAAILAKNEKAATTRRANTARHVEAMRGTTVPLDAPAYAGDPDAPTVQETIPATDDPAAAVDAADTEAGVQASVATLESRLQDILTRAYGLDGAEPQTDREIGEALGIGRTRVQQLRTRAEQTIADHPEIRVRRPVR